MRIAFISVNREQLPDAVVPLGLLSVMGSLPSRHDRILIDLCFEPDPLATVRERVATFSPDMVAIGVRNVQSSVYDGMSENLSAYAEIGQVVRDATSAPLVLGGSAVGVIPEILMDVFHADYAIAGEGERAFELLVNALENGAARPNGLERIPRLFFRREGRICQTEPAPCYVDLDRLPRPARQHTDPQYDLRIGIESVQTKRGCGLSCAYCTYPRIEGSSVRTRTPALVVDELMELQHSGRPIRHVFIVDSVFNRPRRHAKAICREMITRGFTLPWTCYVNPLGFDQELADLMVAAGCAGVEIGSDSGSNRVLASLRKGFDTARIKMTHDMCRQAGLPDCHTFILGTTTETLDEVQESLDFADELDPFAAIFMVWTDDEDAAGGPSPERRELRKRIEDALTERARTRPRWIVPAMSRNFGPRLFDALRRRGCAGPLWQSLDLASAPSSVRAQSRSLV